MHVFLYDLGVFFYFFILCASLWWGWEGETWTADPACDYKGYGSWAAWLGTFFFWFVVMYAAGWYCYANCMGTGEGMVEVSTSCPGPSCSSAAIPAAC